MQTRKLYYEDCHLFSFTARVTGCEKGEKGWLITLDATAFYPEGGGQACDIGTLGGVRVLDVRERGEDILHLCDGALEVGTQVVGNIEAPRRLDLMQQHTGEHIVSGILHRRFGYHNVGFHVGKDVMEVDFDGPLTAEQLAEVEQEANEAVWQNFPLRCWIPTPEELPGVFYRTKRQLPWPVRIVEVPGVDSCACCGIHVANTGEVGIIKILSCVKFHQGVRLEMVCGGRAWKYLAAVFDQNRQVSQLFSANILETADAAKRAQDALAAEKFRTATLEKQVFGYIAESYVNKINVLHFEDGLQSTALRELAEAIGGVCGGWAAVFSGSDDGGYGYCIVTREGDLRPLGKAMAEALNGRGGGKPNAQQGRVQATREAIEAFFAEQK